MKTPLRSLALPLLTLALAACGAEPAPDTDSGRAAPAAPAEAPAAAPQSAPEASEDVPAVAPEAQPEEPARTVGTEPGERIPAFTVEGTAGDATRTVRSQAPGAVTIYLAGSTTCPYTNKYAKRMRAIESAFTAKGVQFVWLYPNSSESDEDKSKWHADKGLAGTFVIDRDAKAATALDILRTPEIVVTDAEGTITYRGAIDDGKGNPKKAKAMWTADALEATLAGEPIDVRKTVPAG